MGSLSSYLTNNRIGALLFDSWIWLFFVGPFHTFWACWHCSTGAVSHRRPDKENRSKYLTEKVWHVRVVEWTLWNTVRYYVVSNCGITKILQVTVYDGCPSQLASKLLTGVQHKCQYICEYSTNCKYDGIMGFILNIPISRCITLWGLL